MTDFPSISVQVEWESQADYDNFFAALINDLKTIIGSAKSLGAGNLTNLSTGIIQIIFHSNFISGKSKNFCHM